MRIVLVVVSCLFIGLLASPANAAERSSQLTAANQWVSPAEPGVVRGRLLLPVGDGTAKAVPNARVSMVGSDGQPLQGRTDETGRFVIEGAQAGVYALAASNGETFACCALQVISGEGGLAELFPGEAEITAASIDAVTVNQAMRRYLGPGTATAFPSLASIQPQALAERVGGGLSFQVIQSEGGMRGEIYQAGASGDRLQGAGHSNVFILQDGTEVARTVSSDVGTFEIADLDTGNYSLLAIGPHGMAVVGFELVSADSEEPTPAAADTSRSDGDRASEDLVVQRRLRHRHHSLGVQCAPHPQVVDSIGHVGPHEEIVEDVAVDEEVIVDDGFGVPMPGGGFAPGYGGYGGGGGFGGGGGGGGGGLHGGGGLAGLAGLAGIGAVIATTADDDDDDFDRPASPAAP